MLRIRQRSVLKTASVFVAHICVCIIAAITSTVAAQTGTLPEITWRPVYLQDKASGLYLTVVRSEAQGQNTAPFEGQRLRLRPLSPHEDERAAQKFIIRRWGDAKTTDGHTLESMLAEIKFVIDSRPKFTRWEHSGKGSHRFWDLSKSDQDDGYFRFRNQKTGQYFAGMTRENANFDRDYATTSHRGNATLWRVIDARSTREKILADKACENCEFSRITIESRTDLSNLNLRGASGQYFSGKALNLTNADFSGSRLGKVFLPGANLTSFKAVSASFTISNFYDADLTNADFSNAKMAGVFLTFASIVGTSMVQTSAEYGDFFGAKIAAADFSNAGLRYGNFEGATFSNVILRGANLTGANFRWTDLSETDLSGAVGFDLGEDDRIKLCNTILPNGSRTNRNCAGGYGPNSLPMPERIQTSLENPQMAR